jgi:uroporphyrinogen III methyltransferase/synthase
MGASEETSSPLHNKRILVTRAEDQAQPLIERIRQLGGDPVQFPTIGFAPLEDFGTLDAALERADRFNWIVFTSANGVRFVAERMQERGQGVQTLSGGRVAAIGPATARALESLGIRVDFVPTRFLGEQIATELPIEPGQSALLLRADIASDVLARRLIERGVLVTNVNAYRTVRPETGRQRETPDLSSIDAVTFTSSSTVRNFNEILDGRRDALAHAEVFCIGPVTADTARELGWRVDAVAEEHPIDGLVGAIVKYCRTR